MKFLAILILIFSGCATVSEYNQGCRDGITRAWNMRGGDDKRGGVNDVGPNQGVTEYFCDMLDAQHRAKEHQRR